MTANEYKKLKNGDRIYWYSSFFGLGVYEIVDVENYLFREVTNDGLGDAIKMKEVKKYHTSEDKARLVYYLDMKKKHSEKINEYTEALKRTELKYKNLLNNFEYLEELYPEFFV